MKITASLLEKHLALFHQSISHPLTAELCLGTLSDRTLWVYLDQDLKFFQLGLNVMGKALALCDDAGSAIRLGKQIGFVLHDENDYFHRVLGELEAAGTKGPSQLMLPKVKEYLEYLRYLTFDCESYLELVTFLWVMEKVYVEWPLYNKAATSRTLAYKHQMWIDLHAGADFEGWVAFLEAEVDRVAPSNPSECEQAFTKAVELETAFFDECYNYSW